jgi:maltoporin
MSRIALLSLLLLASVAPAATLSDRVDLSMYGNIGVGMTPSGKVIQGKTFNLTGKSLGGRLEEGDYLEPSIKVHFLKQGELGEDAPWAHAVVTPAMWAKNGLFIGLTSNRFSETLTLELGEAYVSAGNVITKGLNVWAGARFYRGTNVWLSDYWYFNNLSAQGVGFQYKGFDVAALMQTSMSERLYNLDADGDGVPDVRRQRTALVGQYVHKLNSGHAMHVLTEGHYLPSEAIQVGSELRQMPNDFGWVAGLKGHIDLGNDSFNDLSVRYGSGIANGGQNGNPTWVTFGLAGADGRYRNANSLELVEHLVYNVSPLLTVNGYGIMHMGRGGSGDATDRFTDFAVGGQTTLYLHDHFHLVNEASFQGVRNGTAPMGTAVKFSLVPTIVPSGQHSNWARPHLKMFYTVAFYNQHAVNTLQSPFLKVVGPERVGHYMGARVEWWL